MSLSCFIQLLIVAAVFALAGYYGVELGGIMTGAPAGSVFATGLMLGIIIGGLGVALRSRPAGEKGKAFGGRNMSIYVGNIPFNAGENDIRNLFAPFGTVIEVRMVKDRRSRRSKGYAFVEMAAADAKAAIKQLDGTEYAGRTLRVNEAREKNSQA